MFGLEEKLKEAQKRFTNTETDFRRILDRIEKRQEKFKETLERIEKSLKDRK